MNLSFVFQKLFGESESSGESFRLGPWKRSLRRRLFQGGRSSTDAYSMDGLGIDADGERNYEISYQSEGALCRAKKGSKREDENNKSTATFAIRSHYVHERNRYVSIVIFVPARFPVIQSLTLFPVSKNHPIGRMFHSLIVNVRAFFFFYVPLSWLIVLPNLEGKGWRKLCFLYRIDVGKK